MCPSYRSSVAEGCVEGFSAGVEQMLDVRQTLDLKLLRLLLDHLPGVREMGRRIRSAIAIG